MLSSAILCFVFTSLAMPPFIRYMHRQQFGQMIREEGPTWHESKSGTPTMGGAIMVFSAFLALLLISLVYMTWWKETWLLMLALLFFGGIGFSDDFLKIFKKQNEGLSSKQKFLLQLASSAFVVLCLPLFGIPVAIPLFSLKTSNIFLIFIFMLFWLTGFSNAYNLTDGLDGLATGLGIISFITYFFIAMKGNQVGVMVFCSVMVSSLLAFLLFNIKPAKIFMGDVGSLAIGASLALVSLLLGRPWSLLLVGFIYVAETVSVILQVASFKLTGKRIFKMSPIHHHFEMLGWSEWRVVLTFWALQAVLALVALIFA